MADSPRVLWGRLEAALRRLRAVPEGQPTPQDVARHADRELKTDAVGRFVREFLYPIEYGDAGSAMPLEEAEAIVDRFESKARGAPQPGKVPDPAPPPRPVPMPRPEPETDPAEETPGSGMFDSDVRIWPCGHPKSRGESRCGRCGAAPAPELKNVDTLFKRCLERMAKGDSQGAEADANAVITLDPDYCEAWILRSLIRYLRDMNGSYLDYSKASKLAPRSVEGVVMIQTLQVRFWPITLQIMQAEAGDKLPIPVSPLTRGVDALLRRNLDGAANEFQSVPKTSMEWPLATTGMALVRYWKKDYKGALQSMKASGGQGEVNLRFMELLHAILKGG